MGNLGDQIKNLSPEKRALLERKLAEKGAGSVSPRPSQETPTIPRRQASDPRILSPAQRQMWFLDQLAPGSAAYNAPFAVRLTGKLDVDALQKALDAIVGRHEVLRTMYLSYQGKVIPAVAKNWAVELRQTDLRDAPHDFERDIQPLMQREGARPFDLAKDLKLRATLYRLTDDVSIFLHVSHHIAWDLQSRIVFYRELELLYRAFRDGEPVNLPEPPIQYADYALYQHRELQGEKLESLEAYWKGRLTGAPPALHLPIDFPRPALQDLNGLRLPVRLSATLLEDARTLARENKVTLYIALLASFKVFLYAQSGQVDISIGSPFDGRRHPATEPVIGMFINTLVLRTKLEGGATFRALLLRVRDTVLGAIAHQDLPFEKIVDAVQPPRDPGRMPLFQVNFRLQGTASPPLKLADLQTEPCRLVDNATSKFDLALELPSVPEGWGYLEYGTSLFKPTTAARMADEFQRLLCDVLARPDMPIDQLDAVRAIKAGITENANA